VKPKHAVACSFQSHGIRKGNVCLASGALKLYHNGSFSHCTPSTVWTLTPFFFNYLTYV